MSNLGKISILIIASYVVYVILVFPDLELIFLGLIVEFLIVALCIALEGDNEDLAKWFRSKNIKK